MSKTTYYRRLKRSIALGCSPEELPDGRGKHSHHISGSNHYRWNNGSAIGSNGYVRISVGKNHPLADPNGYAYLHLLIWISAGNQKPKDGEIIHHFNMDKTDNRIENLRLMTNLEHLKLHSKLVKMPELDGRIWAEYPE
jgi:hypothetical protein